MKVTIEGSENQVIRFIGVCSIGRTERSAALEALKELKETFLNDGAPNGYRQLIEPAIKVLEEIE